MTDRLIMGRRNRDRSPIYRLVAFVRRTADPINFLASY